MLLHFTGLELSKLLKRFFITSFRLEYLAEAGLHCVSCLRALDDMGTSMLNTLPILLNTLVYSGTSQGGWRGGWEPRLHQMMVPRLYTWRLILKQDIIWKKLRKIMDWYKSKLFSHAYKEECGHSPVSEAIVPCLHLGGNIRVCRVPSWH